MKVIYDAQTGTVLNMDQAMVVDIDDLATLLGVTPDEANERLADEDEDAQEAALLAGYLVASVIFIS